MNRRTAIKGMLGAISALFIVNPTQAMWQHTITEKRMPLMEDAMVVHRLIRSPENRKIYYIQIPKGRNATEYMEKLRIHFKRMKQNA